MIWFLAGLWLWHQISALQIKLKPVSLAITQPQRTENFLKSLFLAKSFPALSKFLMTKGFDFYWHYGSLWERHGSLKHLNAILEQRNALTPEELKALLNPDCLFRSKETFSQLNEQVDFPFSTLPFSFLEAKHFQPMLLSPENFDLVLSDAIERHLHNRQMNWFNWLENVNLGYTTHLQRAWNTFYYEKGWLFVNPEVFREVDDRVKAIMLSWIYPDEPGQVSEIEKLLRKLSFYACFEAVREEKENAKGSTLKLKKPAEMEFSASSLFQLVEALKASRPRIHGDWLIGILTLWRPVLSHLSTEELDECLDFLFSFSPPTVMGTCRLLQLTANDERVANFVYEREGQEFLLALLQQCPSLLPPPPLPLQTKWQFFAGKLRIFAGKNDPKLNSDAFGIVSHLSAWFGNNYYYPRGRGDVLKALYSTLNYKWFNKFSFSTEQTRTFIPNGRMPRLFARIFGFYFLLARVFGLRHPIHLDPSFLLPNSPISTPRDSSDSSCQFQMSLEGSPNGQEMSVSPLQGSQPGSLRVSPPTFPVNDGNFDCFSKFDIYALQLNMNDEFNAMSLSPELIAFSPGSTLESIMQCQHDVIVYQRILKEEFELGMQMHINAQIFTLEESQTILRSEYQFFE